MQVNQQHDSVDVIGVDVGKGQHHAVAVDRTGKRLYNTALPNDEAKLRALITDLKAYGQLLFVVDQPATNGALPVAVVRDEGASVGRMAAEWESGLQDCAFGKGESLQWGSIGGDQ